MTLALHWELKYVLLKQQMSANHDVEDYIDDTRQIVHLGNDHFISADVLNLRRTAEGTPFDIVVDGVTFIFRARPLVRDFMNVRRRFRLAVRQERNANNFLVAQNKKMIRRYGCYNLVRSAKDKAPELYIEACDATEQYRKDDTVVDLILDDYEEMDRYSPCIVFLVVNLFRTKIHMAHMKAKHCRLLLVIFIRFATHFLRSQPVGIPLLLGYLMFSCSHPLYEIIQRTSHWSLNRMLYEEADSSPRGITHWKIKNWTAKNIQNTGLSWVRNVIQQLRAKPCFGALHPSSMYILGQMSTASVNLWDQHHNDHSRKCFTMAIINDDDLYIRIKSMVSLVSLSNAKEEYLFSRKLLQCAYKLAKGYCAPFFLTVGYNVLKTLIDLRISSVRCVLCGFADGKLHCCTGCLRSVYCSRKCQKRHWHSVHRRDCSGQQKAGYDVLNRLIFNRM